VLVDTLRANTLSPFGDDCRGGEAAVACTTNTGLSRRLLIPTTSIVCAEHKVASDDRPRRSRAAAAMAATLADAISSVFIGRFEKVPNPQSGFRNTRSAG